MLKILYIGNSFSVDGLEYSVEVAHNLGVKDIKVGNLYYAACSLKMHLNHALKNSEVYSYFENDGNGWAVTENVSIDTAIKSDDWDIIGIFPGTGDGSMHSGHEAYKLLGELIEHIKSLASPKVKLLYSLTWLSDKENPKKELALYNGNQELVMSMICDRIREYVIPTNEFWRIIPFGAAVQNARNENILITRDGYHLSYGLGRFMAALTFVGSITDVDISQISWMPTSVTEDEKNLAVRFAQKAILDPYQFKQFENKL